MSKAEQITLTGQMVLDSMMNKIVESTPNVFDKTSFTEAFLYGSRIYGTHHEASDYDYLFVTDNKAFLESGDDSVVSVEDFQKGLDNNHIPYLECVMAQPSSKFTYTIDPWKIRCSASAIASNAWVKGKKKLNRDSPDFAPYIGRKSAWHALRVVDFAIQILEHGKIYNFGSMNEHYHGIMACIDWEDIDINYRRLGNLLKSRLRILSPTPQ